MKEISKNLRRNILENSGNMWKVTHSSNRTSPRMSMLFSESRNANHTFKIVDELKRSIPQFPTLWNIIAFEQKYNENSVSQNNIITQFCFYYQFLHNFFTILRLMFSSKFYVHTSELLSATSKLVAKVGQPQLQRLRVLSHERYWWQPHMLPTLILYMR